MYRVYFRLLAQFGYMARLVTANSAVTIPAPIVVEPSQSFDGNDGLFSSFNISVGTPAQSLKVFISTSNYQVLVVIKEGCGPNAIANCATLRGGQFFWNSSSTWQNNTADLKSNIYPLQIDEQLLGDSARAFVGFDEVSLDGNPGVSLKNQTVGGFAVTNSYLGLLGIDPRSSVFQGQPPVPSYLQNLRNQSLIPSLSWGYTAGSYYRNIYGSLTLGGYDQSRFVHHDSYWSIDGTNNLEVQIQSIIWTDSDHSGLQGLLAAPITVSLDSALPYIWLPEDACLLFENAFDLQWDENSQLYLVNSSLHASLLSRNPSITFNIGGMTGGSDKLISITLPYAALDLTASSPLVGNATRYFPLRRASNETQYVIGRTFFQEAFIIADYERRNFSVFPCQWTSNAKAQITSTFSPTYNLTGELGNNSSASSGWVSGSTSNTGAIAGGVVGGVAVVAIIAILIWLRQKKKKTKDYTVEDSSLKGPPTPKDPHANNAELGNTQQKSPIPELQGNTFGMSEAIFELPAQEEVAKEMGVNVQAQELATPETVSEGAPEGFPWRFTLSEGSAQFPSPLSSPELEGTFSPLSNPSPEPISPITGTATTRSSVITPLQEISSK